WFEYYESHGRNARLACRYFGISPQTFYRWKRRYRPYQLESLEDRSRRPNRLRQPAYPLELVTAVKRLREEYPCWGKDKLVRLLWRESYRVSTSMVGRILQYLKKRGVLHEPVRNHISAHKRRVKRPYAVRKPKDYEVGQPGDLIQLDSLDIRPLPRLTLKQFTARDVVSRWDVLGVYSRATATTASRFLDELQQRMPFPIRAIQVDGGSEFEAGFEEECRSRNLRLFVLPPRSPKLNGCAERANRTHTEEFYEVTDSSFDLPELRPELLKWERVYNTIRPHQALGYLTPLEFVTDWKTKSCERRDVSLMYRTSAGY
ncbi:MAG: integrase core domain-containing protein, partial [Chloroflexota bacterium]